MGWPVIAEGQAAMLPQIRLKRNPGDHDRAQSSGTQTASAREPFARLGGFYALVPEAERLYGLF